MERKHIKKNEAGFSLVELVIVSVVLVTVIGILSTLVGTVQNLYADQRPRTEALNDATAALDILTRLIRTAGNNPNGISGLQGIDPGTAGVGGVYRTIRIRSDWRGATMSAIPDGDTSDPFENVQFTVSNNTLMKQETPADAAAVAFLDNVSDLRFTYYNSDNQLLPDPTTTLALIARIDIEVVMLADDGTPMTFSSSAYLRHR